MREGLVAINKEVYCDWVSKVIKYRQGSRDIFDTVKERLLEKGIEFRLMLAFKVTLNDHSR